MSRFFPIFYAKSAQNNPLSIDVKGVIFESEEANPLLFEFEAKYDHNMEKLFSDISLLAKN